MKKRVLKNLQRQLLVKKKLDEEKQKRFVEESKKDPSVLTITNVHTGKKRIIAKFLTAFPQALEKTASDQLV